MGTDKYQEMIDSISDGTIDKSSPETQIEYLSILCKNSQQTPKSEDIIMGITINHVSMKQHIDKLNKQNEDTQKWVIRLAVAALIGTAIQSVCAIRAEIRSGELSSTIAMQRQTPEIRSYNPTLGELPSLSQPTEKKKEPISSSLPPEK